MGALLACPFCRTLYRQGEGTTCAICGVTLVAFERLPRSVEAETEADEHGEANPPTLPEDEVLRWNDFGRGRGALLVLSALGLVLFFMPWVSVEMPEDVVWSGYDLARGRAGWLWGGATGWLILAPLAWSRRTIRKMLGARPISAMLAAMTLFEVGMLAALPPRGGGRLPVEIHWAWGLYVSAAVSLAGAIIAMRFGGALPPIGDDAESPSKSGGKRILH
jgi:hypothetical protein